MPKVGAIVKPSAKVTKSESVDRPKKKEGKKETNPVITTEELNTMIESGTTTVETPKETPKETQPKKVGRPKKERPETPVVKRHWDRHPWEKWFTKKKFTLVQGVDYSGKTNSMVQQVRNQASRHPWACRVSIEIAPDDASFTVYIIGSVDEIPIRHQEWRKRKAATAKKEAKTKVAAAV